MIAKNMEYPPGVDEADSLRGAFLGYYRIENGQVILETYGPVAPPAGRGATQRERLSLQMKAYFSFPRKPDGSTRIYRIRTVSIYAIPLKEWRVNLSGKRLWGTGSRRKRRLKPAGDREWESLTVKV
jgi:hypothetical protein